MFDSCWLFGNSFGHQHINKGYPVEDFLTNIVGRFILYSYVYAWVEYLLFVAVLPQGIGRCLPLCSTAGFNRSFTGIFILYR